MDCIKIKFCNSSGFLITNKRAKSNILKNLEEKYYINVLKNFEKSYSDNLLDVIKNIDVAACFITRGKKYLLYLTKINNENISILIDLTPQKDNDLPKLIVIPIQIQDRYFNETVFSGEMLLYNEQWTFIIESCRVNLGKIMNKGFIESIKICQDFIDKNRHQVLCPFELSVKTFFTLPETRSLFNKNKIPIIGLKIFGLKTPVVFYFNTQNYNYREKLPELLPDISNEFLEIEFKNIMNEYKQIDSPSNKICLETNNKLLNIDKKFILDIKPSQNYGIYNVFCFNNKSNQQHQIGISRIKTIELNNDLITIFKKNKHSTVRAIYNPDFCKWEICDIDINEKLSHLEQIQSYLEKFKTYKKAVYID